MQSSNRQISDPGVRAAPKGAVGAPVHWRPRLLDTVGRAMRSFWRQREGRAAVHILPGESQASRKRAENWEQTLSQFGVKAKVAPLGKESFAAMLSHHAAFVVTGVLDDPRVKNFLQHARERGRPIVLDSAPLAVRPDAMVDLLSNSGPGLPWGRSLAINWVVRAPIAERSGRSQVVFRIANELGRRGHRVRVYIDPVEHLSRLSPGEIVDYTERYFGPLFLEPIIGLRTLSDADVAIATCWKSSEFVARDARSLFQFRFIQEIEENLIPEGHRYFKRSVDAYRLPLQPIAFGQTLAPRIQERAPAGVEAVDRAVDQEGFLAKSPPEERGAPHRVLFYARPDRKERGFSLGMEALRLLAERYPEIEITIFGSQEEDIGPLGFPVRHIGIPSRSNLASEMNRAQVVLSLSLSGTVSSVSLEAMACGAVVVESELSGLADILSPGEGFRLAPAKPVAVAETIGEILDNADLRVELARAGIRAMQKRDWSSTFNQFERILLERCFATTDVQARPAHLARVAAG